jgi:1-aminocyclopropane-1-carboxylate deaminase/D-cysteine desulfhydrase-like pyridoxal-dependent ACC family enzyme
VLQLTVGSEQHAKLATQLSFDVSQVGPGYGASTPASERATEIARAIGLSLDQTYTAKAFARVIELLDAASDSEAERLGRSQRILYWHTLAATALEPLLRAAPRESELPGAVRRLLR